MIAIKGIQPEFARDDIRNLLRRRDRFKHLALGLCLFLASAGSPAAESCRAADSKAPAADRKPLSDADDEALAGQLKEAFDEGYVVGPKRLKDAQKHLAQARKTAPGDPRIDYANGLVLLKQGQAKPATAQFEAAVTRDGVAYWPAWQTAIWALLGDKQYEHGLKRLGEFAAIVRQSEKPDEVSELQREAARWMGQLLEAVAHLPETKKFEDLLAENEIKVLDTLGDKLSEALEEGRELMRARQSELDQVAGAARSNADRKKALKAQDKSEQIEKNLEGADKEKEDAKKSEADWKKWLDDMLAASDKLLGQLEKDYTVLEQRSQSLFQSYTLAGTQLTALQLSMSPQNLKNMNTQALNNLQEQYVACQNQMLGYQVEYNMTQGKMSDVSDRGAQAMQARTQGIKRYEDATGQLVKKAKDLDKWTTRMKAEKKKLVTQKTTAKKGAPEKKVPVSLKTVLPINLEHERDRLLASFAGAAKEGPDKGDKTTQ
jgi:hypothetical protein